MELAPLSSSKIYHLGGLSGAPGSPCDKTLAMNTPTEPSVKTFGEMNLLPFLSASLQKMGIAAPTEIQSQAIPAAMAGQDFIGLAQTGSGKTLAFALPILMRLSTQQNSRALVLAPSREMAQQIFKVFSDLIAEEKISSCLVIGGLPSSKQTSKLNKLPQLLVATPGRLNDHLISNKLLLKGVDLLVVDEADRMLDMGFAPQLRKIQSTLRGPRQVLMFSASISPMVQEISRLFMGKEAPLIKAAQAEKPVAELTQKVLWLDRATKLDRLLDELNATSGGVMIFASNQESCERVGNYLKEYGYKTDYIHGALSQGHRNRVVREFRQGQIRVLVTTDLLARGLDVPEVDHVINFDLPMQSEDFLHRIGRTARAGRTGTAITFVTPSDKKFYHQIKAYLVGAKDVKLDANFQFIDRTKKYRTSEIRTRR